ncbi:MAG: VOC family protein [Pseudomonadota bacterium]
MSFTPDNALVWGEIPVRDLDRGMAFYSAVFGYDLKSEDAGPNPVAYLPTDQPGIAGHLYPGEPAAPGTGPTMHLAVPDTLEAAAERCWKAGGTVKSEPIAIPVGRFQYVEDPDGNSIGLFETNKD